MGFNNKTPLFNDLNINYSSSQNIRITKLDKDDELKIKENTFFTKRRCQVMALICVMLLSFGSHYVALALGSLKHTIKKEMNISNTQYGIVQSSVALINTILPLLGGFFVDYFGTTSGSITATSFILFGNILVSLSTNLKSFPLMVLGRSLYGIGSGTVVIVQETIIAQWFNGKGLGTTLGINLAVSRLASFLGMATIVPIANYTKFYGNAFWFATFICFLSWLSNLGYVIVTSKVKKHLTLEELDNIKAKKEFKIRHLFTFPKQFWILMIIAYTMIGGWTTFLHLNTELVKLRHGDTEELAAWKASVSQIFPIFAPPILGYWIDKRGDRPKLLIFSALCYILSMILLGFTEVEALKGMFTFSLSLAFGILPCISSIPLILPSTSVGTGFGLYKTTWSLGSVIQDIITGLLQDGVKQDKHAYDDTMIFMCIIGVIALFGTIIFYYIDRVYWDSYISMSTKQRLEKFSIQDTESNEVDHYSKRRSFHPLLGSLSNMSLKWDNYLPIILHTILLIVGWVMFIVFLF